jgi:F-type H+-transporting ATPase subunit gamma
MASLKDIRSRIQSTKNTQQITRAMKMVSAAKLRRAQNNVVSARPYAHKILNMIQRISASHRVTHPLLGYMDEATKALIVVVTSDRGLCGGFNASISRYAFETYLKMKTKYTQTDFIFVGRKGAEYFKKRGVAAKEIVGGMDKKISHPTAALFSEQLVAAFADGHYDEVFVIYNEFKSALVQTPTTEKLLPVRLPSMTEREAETHDILFEPQPEEMIDTLLKKHFGVQIYRCLCESLASEHGARMTAMENATKNAQEMIRQLTLTYNKVRQASITTELTEITSGAEALKG